MPARANSLAATLSAVVTFASPIWASLKMETLTARSPLLAVFARSFDWSDG
jgi:hypothetical protein